jgi:hypothetical protein
MRFNAVSRFVAGLLLWSLGVIAEAADLGVKMVYKKDVAVPFAGFTLTFVGERRVMTEKFPPGMKFYDFKLSSAQGTQTVSWTSGTGDIGPVLFRVGNAQYGLELRRSDKLGKLKDDEMVVTEMK